MVRKRIKVLFLSQRFLFPMDTGGKIRTGRILEHLSKIFDITLISNVESSKDEKYLSNMDNLCSKFLPVYWKEPAKYSFRFYLKVIMGLFSRYPVTVRNDYSRDLENAIKEALKKDQFDLLICDFLQPSLNFREVHSYPTLLFQHNVESIIMERYHKTTRFPPLKLFWWIQWWKMGVYEGEACRRFTGVVTVSGVDKKLLEDKFSAKNVFSIPTGIDTNFFSPGDDSKQKRGLVFTGSMDWLPNEDAILFFAKEILHRIKREVPNIKLTVVGRNPSRRLLGILRLYPEIEVIGWVPDVRPFIHQSAVYVIPLRIGGGTRIKAYEAMAMGKPVVTTTIGVEGLPVRNDEHAIIVDDPHEFSGAIIRLLGSPQEREKLGGTARAYVVDNFSWEKATNSFADICRKIVNA